jgi:DNA polymerase-3 subunit delta
VTVTLQQLVAAVARGETLPVYVVAGETILAEPAGRELAGALAKALQCEPEVHRRPARLAPLLGDLRTFSLFSPAKVLLAIDTALFADRTAVAELVNAAREVGEVHGELSARERVGASRLLQALRLVGIDPHQGGAEEAIARLPENLLGGKKRGTDAPGVREQLARLLAAAREADLYGYGESDLAELAQIVQDGLPRGHALVLVERSAAAEHPVIKTLAGLGAVVQVGEVEAQRGSFAGLDAVVRELEHRTGVGIESDALAELARRTLRSAGVRDRPEAIDGDSTARFAAEYAKLAESAQGKPIRRALVETSIADRGEEDVWKLLDAIAEGRAAVALAGLERLLGSSDDPMAERLSFFSLLASFCRQLVAVGGLLSIVRAPRGESNYHRFKERIAPELQKPLADGRKSPLAGIHPFRLHRVYLAASGLEDRWLAGVPWRLLELELQMKGECSDPQAALSNWIAELAGQIGAGRAPKPGPRGRAREAS